MPPTSGCFIGRKKASHDGILRTLTSAGFSRVQIREADSVRSKFVALTTLAGLKQIETRPSRIISILRDGMTTFRPGIAYYPSNSEGFIKTKLSYLILGKHLTIYNIYFNS
jgi:hypothetical protein